MSDQRRHTQNILTKSQRLRYNIHSCPKMKHLIHFINSLLQITSHKEFQLIYYKTKKINRLCKSMRFF